jgi:hypothetical protein
VPVEAGRNHIEIDMFCGAVTSAALFSWYVADALTNDFDMG